MWREWAVSEVIEGLENGTDQREADVARENTKSISTNRQVLLRKSHGMADVDRNSQKDSASPKIVFPSTRYYGSKRKQLDWLRSELKALDGRTALDAFGGTGAVSHLLQDLGWEATYNDVFEFNIISARALFSDSTFSLTERALSAFLQRIKPLEGFITATFEGLYFTTAENMWLDGFMSCLRNESEPARDLMLYCLFQACLKKRPFNLFHRANLDLRHSDIPVKFGNRTTWSKSFNEHILTTYFEVSHAQQASILPVQVTEGGCATAIPPGFDLVYLDPPYFKRAKKNTETYLERYHFLEGLARYDEWPNLIDVNSAQRVIKRPYKQEWTKKQEMLDNLRYMFKRHEGAKFVMSYISGEEPTEEELFEIFRDNFNRVHLSRCSFTRVLSKKQSFEILLIGQ